MKCECPECSEFRGPDPSRMRIRFTVLLAQLLIAVLGLIRERSWKALVATLGALAFFLTVPRYLICCRCEGYGEKCYSLYLGKITSSYLPKVEGKQVSPLGALLELITLSTITNAPAIGLRRNRGLLLLYLSLACLTTWLQFNHACRHCAAYATDWKRLCPASKAASKFLLSRESSL